MSRPNIGFVGVSIGILAHNEEQHIEETLRSLFAQDIFQLCPIELVIVVNGCTDKTAEISRAVLEDCKAKWSTHGTARIEELKSAGKANAWNKFVHESSSQDASTIILMDADIKILERHVLSSLVLTLKSNPQAVLCVDRPIKNIELKANRTILERLLFAATPKIDANNVPLCGQLYCALGARLREIKLPIGITCDDGFLRGLLLTHGFIKPEDSRLIVMDSTVSHSFESVASLPELFRHEKWIVAGNIVNALLFERFWAESKPNCNAMTLMSEWHAKDPQWLQNYIQAQTITRGWHLLPKEVWTRRWSRLSGLSLWKIILLLPVTAIAATLDATIFISAIRDVRRGRAFHYWGKT